MRIENIRLEGNADRPRLAATFHWEDSERPAQDVFFECGPDHADALACCPEPFLAAGLTPGLWAGERRIKVQDPVCPEMLCNLQVVAGFFRHWFRLPATAGVIEAQARSRPLELPAARTSALFFSGGLDSLAALRTNRLTYPPHHPGWLRDGILVFGLEVEDEGRFAWVLESTAELAREAGVNLIPVSTNIRVLNPDWVFWWNGYMGPALCAIAHALSRRLASVVIASDYEVPQLRPHGSHPVIEPNFSSHEFRVRYDGVTISRLEKARLVARWEPALRHLRVCNKPDLYQRGQLNCGTCEKCIRTMLELLVAGVLDRTVAFAQRDLSAELVLGRCRVTSGIYPYYQELVAPLKEAGRHDLAGAVELLIARARGETGWKGRLRRYDRLRLNGSLRTLKQALLPTNSNLLVTPPSPR